MSQWERERRAAEAEKARIAAAIKEDREYRSVRSTRVTSSQPRPEDGPHSDSAGGEGGARAAMLAAAERRAKALAAGPPATASPPATTPSAPAESGSPSQGAGEAGRAKSRSPPPQKMHPLEMRALGLTTAPAPPAPAPAAADPAPARQAPPKPKPGCLLQIRVGEDTKTRQMEADTTLADLFAVITAEEEMEAGSFALVVPFPRTRLTVEEHGGLTLRQADLVPRATLMVQRNEEHGRALKGAEVEPEMSLDALRQPAPAYNMFGRHRRHYGSDDDDDDDYGDDDDMSYDALNSMIERVGKVPRAVKQSLLDRVPKRKATQEETSGRCTICQFEHEEGEEVSELPCEHIFHPECIAKWMRQDPNCPTCRTDVRPLLEAAKAPSASGAAGKEGASPPMDED